jgi:glycosyltransferase involved in cell wall biosynthesis
MNLKASIVIPAYNSAQRLHIPLESLVSQTAANGSFEVIIIDNASTDGTGDIARNHWTVAALKERNIDCHVVRENRKGLTYARIRGICEARGLFVCFLDDDNAPDADYVAEGIAAFFDDSIGLLVSRIYPKYESVFPTPSMERREHLLAINQKMGDSRLEWEATATIAPTIGAGMWVRRAAFLSAVPWQSPNLMLSDRIGKNLTSGGDIEIGFLLGKAGFKRVYLPRLILRHVIPASRLTTQYFCRLIIGIVRSTLTLDAKYMEKRYGLLHKCASLANLMFALVASPLLVLRRDGFRELLFVILARWAAFLGPYSQQSHNSKSTIYKQHE